MGTGDKGGNVCYSGVVLLNVNQNVILCSYFSTKRVLLVPGFGDIVIRVHLEFICTFLFH